LEAVRRRIEETTHSPPTGARSIPFHFSFEASTMVERPDHFSKFEFVILSSLRAVQLLRGSIPRVTSVHKRVVIAQMEVASGLVARADDATRSGGGALRSQLESPADPNNAS
jgi:DNA-directed RNA polymerase subunit K/omega